MRCVSGASAAQLSVCTAVLFALTSTIALAAEGCFQYGYGGRHNAPAGVGVTADSRDATAAALNPAGLVHVPAELASGALFPPSLFSPSHRCSGSRKPGFARDGIVASHRSYFLIPDVDQGGPVGSQTRAFCFGKTASFSNLGTDVSWGCTRSSAFAASLPSRVTSAIRRWRCRYWPPYGGDPDDEEPHQKEGLVLDRGPSRHGN
jgi:hypothetical protein